MIGSRLEDRVGRSRARDRARWLVRDHGEGAEAVVAARLKASRGKPEERAFFRLVRAELRLLREMQGRIARPVRRGWLARLFGRRA